MTRSLITTATQPFESMQGDERDRVLGAQPSAQGASGSAEQKVCAAEESGCWRVITVVTTHR